MLDKLDNNALAAQLRRSRPRTTAQLPSERTGVICQPKSNTFLCNGWGCAHPADLRPGFYYPLSKAQIKQLRRAAAVQYERVRYSKRLTPFVPSYVSSVKKWRECMKEARKVRKLLRKELGSLEPQNYMIGQLMNLHKKWLRFAKETRYTFTFIQRLP